MKIVLDTNVLVSGFYPKKSHPGSILDLIIEGQLTVCYSAPIFTEYKGVLSRSKFNFNKEAVDLVLDYIRWFGYLVPSLPLKIELPDKNDEIFLEAAATGVAEYLITGNIKHFPKKIVKDIKVVTPAQFIKIYKAECL